MTTISQKIIQWVTVYSLLLFKIIQINWMKTDPHGMVMLRNANPSVLWSIHNDTNPPPPITNDESKNIVSIELKHNKSTYIS